MISFLKALRDKYLSALFLILPFFAIGQSFTFTPVTSDYLAPDRGAHLWINRDAPFGTIDIPVNNAAQEMIDGYYRFSMTHFFSGTGSDSTMNFSFFRARMGEFTAKRMGIKFRVMANGKNIGNPPGDNFNNLVQYGGGWSNIPQFLHDLQQAEPNSANRDYFSTFGGGYGSWIPNTNSPQFQRWVRKFCQQLRNYIDTAVINSWPLRHAIRIYDIGFYGCFSEQHSACLCNQISDGNIPVGARHTAAGLSAIVDAQLDGMGGNPNWKYVIPFNAYDAMWLSHTFNQVEYGRYLLDHPDSIGWVNDHLGAVEGYDDDYLDFNNRMGGNYNAKLMNRWRYSPLGGEPVGWGSPSDRSGITQYVTHYHLSGFGNGNLDHIAANGQDDDGWPTEANNIRNASRLAGYRLRLTGGFVNVAAAMNITLNWLNEGNAPVYFDWDVKYLIRNGSGTTVATLNSSFDPRYFQPSGAAVPHTQAFALPAIPAGTYGLYVKVVDPNGYRRPMPLAITPRTNDTAYFMSNITITGGGGNQNPVSNAGPNQSITGTTVTLSGSGTDADGAIASYAWSRVSGPNVPTIVSPTSASTNVTGLIAGTYVFNLTVTDNSSGTGSDQVQITVNTPQAPVANAGPNQVISLPTTSVNVSGSGSTDDVGISSYLWSKISGPNTFVITSSSSVNTSITGLTTAGVYGFRLTVADAGELTSSDDMTVTVINPNQAPVANAGPNQTITLPTSSVNLSGSASTDDIGIVTYEWTKVGGPATFNIVSPSSVNTVVNSLVAGIYVFRLTVTDAGNLATTDDVQVTVNAAANTAPVANAGSNQTITLPTSQVTVNGNGSTDNVGIVSYAWARRSGPLTFNIVSPNSVSTIINGLVAGVYEFRLTVTDGGGLTSFDDVQITVNAAPNAAPISNAGNNQTITLPTSSVSLSGSGSTDDVGIVTYLWTKMSGTGGTIATPNSVNTSVTGLTAGIYVFRLTVTDGGGLTANDDVQVVVNPAPNNAPVARAGSNQTIELPTSSVTLNGSTSSDDVSISSYSWAKISGPLNFSIVSPTSATTNVTGLTQGTYTFRLTVTDGFGLTDTDDVNVTVNRQPQPPSKWWWFWRWLFKPR